MKIKLIVCLFISSLLLTYLIGIGSVKAASDDNWFLKAKYGLFVTWAFSDPPWPFDGTVNPDGTKPSSLNTFANGFDVEQFADDAEAMGVEYVNFTAIHAGANVLYPSAYMNSVLPGHSSSRDVIQDLIDELHTRGIKLQLYIHAVVAEPPTISDADAIALGYYDPTDNYKRYNDFVNGLYGELSARYGTDIDAYWIDTITFGPYLDKIDGARLRNTLLSNNPNVPISGNGSAEATVDYGTREDGDLPVFNLNQRVSYPLQTVVCLPTWWWASDPSTSTNKAKYSPEHLYKYLVLTAGTNIGGGGLAIGASPYATEGFEPGIKETMISLGNLIDPVAESIKNTYPSTSFVTLGGTTIRDLPDGVTATRSSNNQYEYIHVLPQGQVWHETTGSGQNQLNYVGTWNNGITHHYSNVINDYATINFTGTQVKLNSFKDTMHGIMAVSIDGGAETNIDLYSSFRSTSTNVYTSPTLSNGSHTLTVRVTGTKNTSSSNYYASIESVEVFSRTSSTLDLPVPLDGKEFSSAVMVRTGHTATLVQDSTGVHITVPDAWDTLDTVIKLTVSEVPTLSSSSVTIPQSQMSIAAVTSQASSYEAYKVIDGNSSTLWISNNVAVGQNSPSTIWAGELPTPVYPATEWRRGTPQSIVLNLGGTYDVNTIRYLPRQDGLSSSILFTFLCNYNIYSSMDGISFTPVKTGQWKCTASEKTALFTPVKAKYIKVENAPGWSYQFGDSPVSAAEINIGAVSSTSSSTNLALNETVSTSSNYSSNTAGEKAVNGNMSLHDMWCSVTGSNPHWITIDLGQSTAIGSYIIKHAGTNEDPILNTRDFKLQYSNDNTNWTDADSIVANTSNITDRTVTPFTARYVRLYITNPTQTFNDRYARIYEFEVYAPATNLALNKTVTTDSVYAQSYPGSNAVDGDDSSFWNSMSSSSQLHWVCVDLGQSTDIGKYFIKHA